MSKPVVEKLDPVSGEFRRVGVVPDGVTPETPARLLVAYYSELYRKTGNAFHLWYAFRVARAYRLPLPSSVLGYLDEVAERVCALVEGDGEAAAPKVVEALGVATRGGGMSLARQAREQQRNARLQLDFKVLRERPSSDAVSSRLAAVNASRADRGLAPLPPADLQQRGSQTDEMALEALTSLAETDRLTLSEDRLKAIVKPRPSKRRSRRTAGGAN